MVSEAMHILQQSTEMVTLKISRVIDQSPQHCNFFPFQKRVTNLHF